MPLPQVNYGIIPYDTEFHKYLEAKDFDLLVKLRRLGFKGLTKNQQDRLKKIYDFFVKIKEHWFPNSTPQCRQVTKNEIKSWLHGSCGTKIVYNENTSFKQDKKYLGDKLIERLLPIIEKLSKRMPAVVYNLIYNKPTFKFLIMPGNKIGELNGDEKKGIAAYDAGNDFMMLTESSIMSGHEEVFNGAVEHEFYHAFDYITVDTTVTITKTDCFGRKKQERVSRRPPDTEGNNRRPNTYSNIVNEILTNLKNSGIKIDGMKVKTLDEMVEEENKKMQSFNQMRIQCIRMTNEILQCSSITDEEALKELNEKIALIKKQMRVWIPTFHFIEKNPYRQVFGVGGDYMLNSRELLVYAVQAYCNGGGAEIKEYNPLLYHVLVNQIMPAFKNNG